MVSASRITDGSGPRATADVIVIGAGVIGSAVTFELARSGRRVVCVDAAPAVGAGSTSSSSAIIRFHYSTYDAVLTAWEAAKRWDDLSGYLGVTDPDGMAGFVATGCLVLDHPGTNRATVLALYDELGVPYEELGPAEIRQRFGDLDTGDHSPPRTLDDPAFGAEPHGEVAAYYQPTAGFIDDPMRAAGNFMYAARHHGATVLLNREVTAVLRDTAGELVGVSLADGHTIEAPVVVNCGGPASGRLNRLAGVTDDMNIGHRPLRQEVHVAESPDGFGLGSGTMVGDAGAGVYFRPHLSGTLLVGGTEPECDPLQWVDDPDDYNPRPTVDGFERNMWRSAQRLPTLGVPHRPTGLAALYDVSDDWVPIYDKSRLGGWFMACGTSGNQFKNAPMAGAFMVALVDAADRGIDHDHDPVHVTGPSTGRSINLAAFSRLRQPTATSGTVMG